MRDIGGARAALSSSTHDRRDELAGIGLAVTAGASFGTVAIFAKFAYDSGADALPLLAVRFGITSLVLIVFHLATRRRLRVARAVAIKLLLLGACGYGFEASLFFLALEVAPAGVVTLIFYSYPLLTTSIALATRLEPFRPRVMIALVLGTIGVGTIFSIETGDARGPLLAFAAAAAVAVYFLAAQIVTRGVPPTISATWTAVGATLALSLVLAVTSWNFPAEALPAASALGIVTTFAFITLYAAIARLGSARVAIASMVEPVATVILAALLLDERITLRIGIGAVLIVAALPILAARQRTEPTAPAPDTA
jgi:drug/metabolite transporter (DMT)-like permease